MTLACMVCSVSMEWPRATMEGSAWGECGSLEAVRSMEAREGKRAMMVGQSAARRPA